MPDSAPFVHPHPVYGLPVLALEVAAAWAQRVAAGELDEATALYTPDARLYLDGDALGGRHIRTCLEAVPVFGSGRRATVHGEGGLVVARWEAPSTKEPAIEARCRIEHGLIAEQWIGAPGPGISTSPVPTSSGEVMLTVVTRGDVSAEAVEYARQRLAHLVRRIDEPVLFARVKLSVAPDPARPRRAIAQASLDVNGDVVRAHLAAHEMNEAIDLLERRLADKLEHKAQRTEALRRHRPGRSEPGEWRSGNIPTARPDYFDRPIEERQLVRHKAFVATEQTVEEAAFDMDQLDYDFHLFRDLANGEDSLLVRLPGGTYRLHHLHPVPSDAPPSAAPIAVDAMPPPRLTVDEAVNVLNLGGDRFVFFALSTTERGAVVYRRYDGHYGLITLQEAGEA